MKTIKQLKKELKILRENKGNLGESARHVTFRYLEGQLDSLKEVLKEIDKLGYHKESDTITCTRTKLKQKLVGK